MLRLALPFALLRALSEPMSPAAQGGGAPEPSALETASSVSALCAALQPAERLYERLDVVSRARAEADHDARREAALGGFYRVKVRGESLHFAPYDPEEGVLSLSYRTFLAGANGSFWIWAVHDPGLPVHADSGSAARIVRAAEHKTLALILVFTLPDDADEVLCAHVAGSRYFGLGVEPFRWEYREGDRVLARGGEGGDKPLVTAAQGAKPRVLVEEAEGSRATDFKAAVEGLKPALTNCYQEALRANPGLDGAYVAEVDLADGGERHVRAAMESLQDEPMTRCVTSVLARADLRGPPGQATIPIHFELQSPEGSP